MLKKYSNELPKIFGDTCKLLLMDYSIPEIQKISPMSKPSFRYDLSMPQKPQESVNPKKGIDICKL